MEFTYCGCGIRKHIGRYETKNYIRNKMPLK